MTRRALAAAAFAIVVASSGGAPHAAAPTRLADSRATLTDLKGVDDLRSRFDQDLGHVRIVLLLSPTWPACIKAARWAQRELLGGRPRADLRVYAVWFNMYPGDARSKWPPAILTDPRVTHYWDESRSVGLTYMAALPSMLARRVPSTREPDADAMWDVLYLYGRDDRWSEPAPIPFAWGYPIAVTSEEIEQQVVAVLAK